MIKILFVNIMHENVTRTVPHNLFLQQPNISKIHQKRENL